MSKEILTQTANQQLKWAFNEIKVRLIDASKINITRFTEFVVKQESEYDCREGFEVIRKVYYGYKTDYKLTEYLKEYERQIEQL